MSQTEDKETRKRGRAAFLAFWRGDRKGCFVMERSAGYCDCDVLLPGFADRIVIIWRYTIMRVSRMMVPCPLKVAVLRLAGVKIGRDVYVAPGVVIDPLCPCLIEIGDGVILGIGCRLLTHEYSATHFRVGGVKIGNRSVIGAGSTIRSGVTIGQNVTVGCNSFVNGDVGDGETVGGVPAKPIVGTQGRQG